MGLKLRLILVLMVPVVLLAGVYGYTRSHWEQAELLEDQRQDMVRTGKAIRIAVESALRDRRPADIERLVGELVESQEAIDRIRVFDVHLTSTIVSSIAAQPSLADDVPSTALRQVITTGKPESYSLTRKGWPLLYYIAPIRDGRGRIAGALELVQAATRVQARIHAANRDIIFRLALLVTSIALAAGMMLQRQVLRPLARLMAGIQRVARGEHGDPLPIERRDELGRVAEAFNDMSARLEVARRELMVESERAVELERHLREAATLGVAGRLTSSIAHEIGTPLNIITGRAEFLLKAAPPDSPVRRELRSIVVQIERISRTVYTLLDTVRARPLERHPTSLMEIVEAFMPLLSHAARRRGVRLVTALRDDLPPALVDPAKIQQVLINLVVNALDATEAGGQVLIAAKAALLGERPGVAVTVSDTGSGIPPEIMPRIFEAFFSSKPRGQGTGLGLAICRDIVRAHEGNIEASTEAGVGTTFTFWVPAAPGTPR